MKDCAGKLLLNNYFTLSTPGQINFMLLILLIFASIYLVWILLRPKKTERRRFSLRERRLQREEERENEKED